MADAKVTALGSVTPVLTDVIYIVDDPGGTPASGKTTLTDVQTLLNASTSTLTNKTLTAPVLSGTVTGTYTLGGTPTFPATVVLTTGTQTLTNKTIGAATISGDLVPNADGTVDLGSTTNRFAVLSVDSIDLNGVTLDGTTLADPGADRILFWDDSAGTTAYLTAGTGLSISGTTLSTTGLASLGANEFTGTQDFNGQQVEAHVSKVVTSVTGTLTTTAHSGNILVTSGNVTVPTTAGFNCILIAGGAHTVTFNSTTSAAMAAGDIMTIVVESGTVIHAVLTAAADKVSFA